MNSSSAFDNKKLFEQNKDLLKNFTSDELNSILKDYNFIIRRIDNLWQVCYFTEQNADYSCSFTGANLSYLLTKMVKTKKEIDMAEQDRNIFRITNGC